MEYKILIVDDNHLVTGLLSKLLHSLGYDVTVAHSGREAMKVLKKIRPRVIFLDLGMPSSDGFEIAKKLRRDEKFEETVLVAFSGRCRMEDKLKARKAGFDHYVHKSASISQIRLILNAYDF